MKGSAKRRRGIATTAAIVAVAMSGASAAAAAGTTPPPKPVTIADLGVHLQTIPGGAADYSAQLGNAVQLALADQSPEGSFEVPGKIKDLGDNSLGVSSLLALRFQQTGRSQTELIGPFSKSIDWFLANRVYTKDNPGYTPWLKVPNSGDPYAEYIPSIENSPGVPAAAAFGDWPTTAWAFLDVGNILQLGDGLLSDAQRQQMINLGYGYYDWLTRVSQFDPQDADNQAISVVMGALNFAKQLERLGHAKEGRQLSDKAMTLYRTQVRPKRQTDRGFTFFPEHSGGFDQNYGGITVSDLWTAYRISGERVFYDDGLEMAKYLDMRLGARGFDYGGPRHNEDHPGFEALYGLKAYSNVLQDDLGRYLGTPSIPYFHVQKRQPDGVVEPDGHFAFMTVMEMLDPSPWYTTPRTVNDKYTMRDATGSVVFDADLRPYLITAGNAEVIQAATAGQQGIGLALRDASGTTRFLTPAAGAKPAQRTLNVNGALVKIVTSQAATPSGASVPTRTAYVLSGGQVSVLAAVDGTGLPAGGQVGYVAGLPYLTDVPGTTQQQKILDVTGRSGGTLSFGQDGATLSDPAAIEAGPLEIGSPAGVTVTNPPSALPNAFSDSATLRLTLEQYSVGLNSNPNVGFASTQVTNLVQVPAQPEGNGPWRVAQVSYGPAGKAALSTALRSRILQLLLR